MQPRLHGEVYSDEVCLAWSYALTVSRTHSSMRLSSSASTSWLVVTGRRQSEGRLLVNDIKRNSGSAEFIQAEAASG
jgi:hypothetical protein